MQPEQPEQRDADQRPQGDADGAGGDIDRHACAQASLGQQRAHVECAEWMKQPRSQSREEGQRDQKRKARHEADQRERDSSPYERESGEPRPVAVGEDAEQRLEDRCRA